MNEHKQAVQIGSRRWPWNADKDVPRVLHTMLRVRNFDASLRINRNILGKTEFEQFDNPSPRAPCKRLGFECQPFPTLELTQNWDEDSNTHGDACGHFATGVAVAMPLCERVAETGGEIVDWPRRVIEKGPSVASSRGPDGFILELVQMQRE